jgi:hypothetical protein
VNAADDTRLSLERQFSSEPRLRRCPGCRVELPVTNWPQDTTKYNASPECAEVAGELLGFELEHVTELGHLHQLRIDAYGAQHVGPRTAAIGTVFALNGLYMYLERGSGNLEVRTAHSIMANSHSDWPTLTPPAEVGDLTAHAVLMAGTVEDVGKQVIAWADEVWSSWPARDQQVIRDLTVALVPARYLHR